MRVNYVNCPYDDLMDSFFNKLVCALDNDTQISTNVANSF